LTAKDFQPQRRKKKSIFMVKKKRQDIPTYFFHFSSSFPMCAVCKACCKELLFVIAHNKAQTGKFYNVQGILKLGILVRGIPNMR
jgi:hypothetical protein